MNLYDKLLSIAKSMQKKGAPISIDDTFLTEDVIMGPTPKELLWKRPKTFSVELYEISNFGLDARKVEGTCIYSDRVKCYFNNKKKYNCPIAPLCKAYEKY